MVFTHAMKSNPFGVLEFLQWNHAWNSYKYTSQDELKKAITLMKEAGIGFVRMDFLWEDIEPQEGEFYFSRYDLIVDLLYENNIGMLGLLNYTAAWASVNGKWNYPPRENRLFVNYAVKVAERYKNKVKYWEVWNEPDSATYWAPQDGLKSYCRLLKEVYVALKKIDPQCKVLNGGIAEGIGSVNHLYNNGAGGYFDILNIHFFETPLHRDAIKAVIVYPKLVYKKMCAKGDAGKKIWITEIGCPGVKKGLDVLDWWIGENPDEDRQAEWLTQVYTELLKDKNVEKIFWAFFRDTNKHWNNGVDYFGLVRWDYSRKPSFKAYRDCYQKWKKDNKVIEIL